MKRFQTIALLLIVLTGYLLPQSAKAGKLRTAHSEISFSPWSSTAGLQNPNGEGRYDPNIVSDGKHTSFSYEALLALPGEKNQEGTGEPIQIRSFESKVTPISPGSYTFSGKIKAGGWYASVFWTIQCLDGGGKKTLAKVKQAMKAPSDTEAPFQLNFAAPVGTQAALVTYTVEKRGKIFGTVSDLAIKRRE